MAQHLYHRGAQVQAGSELHSTILARDAAKTDEQKQLLKRKVDYLYDGLEAEFQKNWPPELKFLQNWKVGYEIDLAAAEVELEESYECGDLEDRLNVAQRVADLKKKCGKT